MDGTSYLQNNIADGSYITGTLAKVSPVLIK